MSIFPVAALSFMAATALVATCLREIVWAPMRNLVHISPQRVRQFHRQSVLSGLAVDAILERSAPPAGPA